MSDSSANQADFALGRTALLEITEESTIGEPAGSIIEGDGVISVYFAVTKRGYPGWRWTVSIARVEGSEPTVLETEMTPGEGALLSPEWVPWSDRLAEYTAAQAEEAGADDDSDDEDSDDDDDDSDDDDFGDLLRGGDSAGDRDGIDIDALEDGHANSDADSDDSDDDGDVDKSAAPQAKVEKTNQAEAQTGDAGGKPQRAVRAQRGRKKQSDS